MLLWTPRAGLKRLSRKSALAAADSEAALWEVGGVGKTEFQLRIYVVFFVRKKLGGFDMLSNVLILGHFVINSCCFFLLGFRRKPHRKEAFQREKQLFE